MLSHLLVIIDAVYATTTQAPPALASALCLALESVEGEALSVESRDGGVPSVDTRNSPSLGSGAGRAPARLCSSSRSCSSMRQLHSSLTVFIIAVSCMCSLNLSCDAHVISPSL